MVYTHDMAGGFPELLADLIAVFGSNRRVADFLGVSHSQVPSWVAGALPAKRNLERISDGAAVLRSMRARGLDNEQVVTELHAVWAELDGRPADLVSSGAATSVLKAIAERYPERPDLVDSNARADLAAALRALASAAASSADALAHGAA